MPVTWDNIGYIQSGSTSQGEGPREEKVAHAREKEKIGGSSGNENCNSVIRKPLSKVTVKSHRPFSSNIRFENGLQMDANGSSESEFLEGLSCYCIVDLAQHVECLHGWLHFNYSSCWCTWRVNAIHGKNCCMDHIFFFRSFLAYTTPSLSKLLQALGQAFQMNDFELKTHRIFLFYFNSLTKWACVKQVGSSCIWSHLVWPNRLHGLFLSCENPLNQAEIRTTTALVIVQCPVCVVGYPG